MSRHIGPPRILTRTSHAPVTRRIVAMMLALLVAGCASLPVPYTGQGPHPQIERGRPHRILDGLGNFFGFGAKWGLLGWRMDRHYISTRTEDALVDYLNDRNAPAFEDTKYRLNEYRPIDDLKRLTRNRHVAWPYRLLLGLPITLIDEVILPGRLFGGDHYNPFTNTVHLYSDYPAVALHEAGHAYDFSQRRYKGTYALLRIIPFVDLYQEFKASDDAIDYLIETGNRHEEYKAYRILYPAYSTYVAGYVPFPFIGIIPIWIGHICGRMKIRSRREFYRQQDAQLLNAPITPAAASP